MSDSETHRRECEARHVLGLPFDQRAPYLALVGKRRGADQQKILEQEIRRQFEIRRKAA
ncbi:DUF7696 family protein [Bordetella avium]|uniref:DUF7696 family protein n=1 Tax=Bordetella avium TaxID=521 RepID=UPI003B8365F0